MRTARVDFHVHTRFSPDGLDDPHRVVAAARRAGLDGIAITDHDRGGAFARLIDAGLANPSGDAVDGFLVIPGVEVSTNQGHVIILGASFDTPVQRGGVNADELVEFAHRLGGLAVAAHPFDRFRSGVGHAVLDAIAFDAVEACNSKTFDRHANRLAADHAARARLPALAGSDAHEARTVGRAHTLVMTEQLSVPAVLSAVRLGRVTPVHGSHTRTELWRYWVRGWLTRPWLMDLSARAAWRMAGAMLSHSARRGGHRGVGPMRLEMERVPARRRNALGQSASNAGVWRLTRATTQPRREGTDEMAVGSA